MLAAGTLPAVGICRASLRALVLLEGGVGRDLVGTLLALGEELVRPDAAGEELAARRVDEVALQLAVVHRIDPVESLVAGVLERLDARVQARAEADAVGG